MTLFYRKHGESEMWTFVDVTTKTKYDHLNQTPGVTLFYRVQAKRGGKGSAWSGEAVAYGGAG